MLSHFTKISFFILLGCALSTGCAVRQLRYQEVKTTCTLSDVPSPCPPTLVLLVHGLNNTPAVFDDLMRSSQSIANRGVLLTLKGHSSDTNVSVLAEDWVSDIHCAQQQLHRQCPNSEQVVISYSLGSLAVLTYLRETPSSSFSKMLFVAPALSTGIIALPIRFLLPLSALDLSLPSFAPEHIRAHTSTPLSHYQALFTLQDSLLTGENPLKQTSSPLCLALNSQDRLVEKTAVIQEFRRWRSKNMTIVTLAPTNTQYGHLVLEMESYLPETWKSVVTSFEQCLALPPL